MFNLPGDVIKQICKNLDSRSLTQLALSCRRLGAQVKSVRKEDPIKEIVMELVAIERSYKQLQGNIPGVIAEGKPLDQTIELLKKHKNNAAWKSEHKALINDAARGLRERRDKLRQVQDALDELWGAAEMTRKVVRQASQEKKLAQLDKVVALFGALTDDMPKRANELRNASKAFESSAQAFWAYTSVKV